MSVVYKLVSFPLLQLTKRSNVYNSLSYCRGLRGMSGVEVVALDKSKVCTRCEHMNPYTVTCPELWNKFRIAIRMSVT